MTKTVQLDYEPQPKQALLHQTKARQILYGGAAGGGKQLRLDTLVVTVSGMKPIGDIVVGDVVITDRGVPTEVVWVSPVETPAECYAVEFDTGEVIEADARHLWKTTTHNERMSAFRLTPEYRQKRKINRPSRAYDYLPSPEGEVRTTAEIAATLRIRGRINHSIAVAEAVELPPVDLPIEPYLLGLWLGDGYSTTGTIAMADADLDCVLKHVRNRVLLRTRDARRAGPFSRLTFQCLHSRLSMTGLLRNKHIPNLYLRASREQRLALLQGLMDMNGYCDSRGQCKLGFSNKRLMEDAHELVSSLGIKAVVRAKRATHNGRDAGETYRMKFLAGIPVFRLPRKLVRQKLADHRPTADRRYIVDVRPIEPVPMRCIQVADPSGMYLVGRSFIPTHNSKSIRMDGVMFALQNPGFSGALFRRTLPELEDNHIRWIKQELPPELGHYHETKKQFEFVNGSVLRFGFCDKESDVERYQGAELHWVGIDEAAHLTDYQISYLKGRNRLGSWVPAKDKERLPRFVMGSNPGGVGHTYLKQSMIDPAPPMTLFYDPSMKDPTDPNDKGWLSIFIPARMEDNRYIDPNYAGSFGGLPPELARALREGDWDAVVGQALHTLSRERHMLRSFTPPKWWTRFMVIDWGTASPFSVGWYCVSEGAELKGREGWPDRWLPSGAVIRYDELYGWNGRPNQGARKAPQVVAREIIARETQRGDTMDYRIGDTEMWAMKSGPSVIDWMQMEDARLTFRKAEKDRKRNYQEILARLAGNQRYMEDGRTEDDPMFFATTNCTHFWRTVPSLVLDDVDPEKGPDTDQEDHVYDEMVYACRSRPFVSTKEDRYYEEFGEEIDRALGKVADPYATG